MIGQKLNDHTLHQRSRSASQAAWLVAFMWVAYFLNYSDRQAIFAMFPVLKSDLKFSDSQLA